MGDLVQSTARVESMDVVYDGLDGVRVVRS